MDVIEQTRSVIHDSVDFELTVEPADGYGRVRTESLSTDELGRLQQLLDENGLTPYPVTIEGDTRKIYVGE